MGTSCIIAKKIDIDRYKCITAHWDGDRVFDLLKHDYLSENQIDTLLEMGDASWITSKLYPTPGVTHTFNKPEDGVSLFYHRDRGDLKEDCGPWYLSRSDMLKTDHDFIYVYDQEWQVLRTND